MLTMEKLLWLTVLYLAMASSPVAWQSEKKFISTPYSTSFLIYEQLPEVQKKREEEKRRSEYKSYRLRAQLYKKKVTNQLLGRKVPWN
ncbi:centrosome-associated protein ALMS1-like [Kogia breviceps]|uniref:centrosome-associated protein ALMS1-like n=1 Tax=Kogia breviceps TaxID=27615 RepID=UPI0034D290E5